MKKFKIQISSRLLYDESDVKKSNQIGKDLKELELGFPEIRKKSEQMKEGIWIASENLRKANLLNFSVAKKKEFQTALYIAQGAVMVPLEEFNNRRADLLGRLERLSRELRAEICQYLEDYISQVEQIKSMEELSRSPNFNLEVSIVQDNYKMCEEMINSLVAFKREIVAMARQSFDEILEEVEKFESKVNVINVFTFEREEIIRPLPMEVSK